jgi:hypothetical protein
VILAFSRISQNYFYIGKVMDRVYGSCDHGWLSVDGGLTTMGWRNRSDAREVVPGMRKRNWSLGGCGG